MKERGKARRPGRTRKEAGRETCGRGRGPGRGVQKPRSRPRRRGQREGLPVESRTSFLNLKGESPSYALLRCLLFLEELESGDVLEALVGEALVPTTLRRFLAEEGHRITEIHRMGAHVWKIVVEKGSQ